MCRLQSLQGTNSSGMNEKTKFYVKEMYATYSKIYEKPREALYRPVTSKNSFYRLPTSLAASKRFENSFCD